MRRRVFPSGKLRAGSFLSERAAAWWGVLRSRRGRWIGLGFGAGAAFAAGAVTGFALTPLANLLAIVGPGGLTFPCWAAGRAERVRAPG